MTSEGFNKHAFITLNVILDASTILMFIDSVFHHHNILYAVISVAVLICCVLLWVIGILCFKEIKKAKEEAKSFEHLNYMQNRFFSSMSHEIRTPIHSILGLNELILRQEDLSEEIQKDANNIQSSGRMLLTLVNDFLDFSKIESGKMEIVPVDYEIEALVSEIVQMIWIRAEEKGLELNVEIDPTLPKKLRGDEVRIKQILINLLTNAVKYTKEGSITLHISMEEETEDEVRLMISVSDTGMGIKQDAIPYLFDAFQRFDEEKNVGIEGTGLGLAIVKQLVELMEGTITVDSMYMSGTTFVVTLCQKIISKERVGSMNVTDTSLHQEKKYEAGFMAPNARLLIVDDNEMNLEVEKKLLSGSEMTIDTARSGQEALKMTYTTAYDLILMDHLMPEMDGIECLRRIRNQSGGLNVNVPMIVLTANAGSANIELYRNSGFDSYLLKPVTGRQLEGKLLQFLPERKIINVGATDSLRKELNVTGGFSKKTPIVITTSSMADMPRYVLNACQIGMIPYIIHVNGKTFYDSYEVGADELVHYMRDGVEFDSEPPTVREFEEFFGDKLNRAHQVLHICLGSCISGEYERATEAAKAYGNVTVYDSTYNSCSMGMMVLLAYRMSTHGVSVEKIVEELDRIKSKVRCSFVTNDIDYMIKRGRVDRMVGSVMRTLNIRPFLYMKNNHFRVGGMSIGNLDKCYERYVDRALSRRENPDLDVCFVPYMDISQEELSEIKERILQRYRFRNVIFIKASAVMCLNCGSGAFGVLFMEKSEVPYNLSSMLSYKEDIAYLDEEDLVFESLVKPEAVKKEVHLEKKWYENLTGIDAKDALNNSGSEETLRSVLKIFYDSVEEKAEELDGFFKEKDWTNYIVKVHALKSSARLIGATKLAKESEKLELSGKENDYLYIEDHHEEMIEDLMAYKSLLSDVFSGEESSPLTKDEPEAEEDNFDRFLLESVYEALRDGARSNDTSMITDTLKEMEEYALPMAHRDALNEIKRCFENEEYDRIIEIANRMKSSLS